MELGDKIHEIAQPVADKLGMKECSGCKKRRAALNEISRRGLIGGAALGFFMLKNTALHGAWKALGATPPIEPSLALGFIRTCLTTQAVSYIQTGNHLSKLDMLLKTAAHKQHVSPDTSTYQWLRVLTPSAESEVLPGWKLHFANVPKGQGERESGFRLILEGPVITFVTDELDIAYQAPTPDVIPNPAELESALAFPEAIGIDRPLIALNLKPPRLLERLTSFLTPVYAQAQLCLMGCCSSPTCCTSCGCLACINSMCGDASCSSTHCATRIPQCGCFFTIACGSNCLYITDITLNCLFCINKCNICAELFSTCCQCTNCPPAPEN